MVSVMEFLDLTDLLKVEDGKYASFSRDEIDALVGLCSGERRVSTGLLTIAFENKLEHSTKQQLEHRLSLVGLGVKFGQHFSTLWQKKNKN